MLLPLIARQAAPLGLAVIGQSLVMRARSIDLSSGGVIVGVGLVALTGWNWLDPALALLVAANIVWTGWRLMHRSASGLMDAALPKTQQTAITQVFQRYAEHGIDYHALRTRQSGRRAFVSFHVLVPGRWSVKHAHDWVERIEADLRNAVPNCHITAHVEPIDDPASLDDQDLDRPRSPATP